VGLFWHTNIIHASPTERERGRKGKKAGRNFTKRKNIPLKESIYKVVEGGSDSKAKKIENKVVRVPHTSLEGRKPT